MRDRCYMTMLDPIQEKYGRLVAFLVYLASAAGDIFWTASILSALGEILFPVCFSFCSSMKNEQRKFYPTNTKSCMVKKDGWYTPGPRAVTGTICNIYKRHMFSMKLC